MESYKILKSVKTQSGNHIQLIGAGHNVGVPLIIGVFHGDEPQGKFLIDEYLKLFSLVERGGYSKLFIPCLNPDGMQLNTRTNANGVDLNRNFPTKNWGEDTSAAGNNPNDYFFGKAPASEIETKFLIEVIEEYSPSVILTLHAPYKVVNYDGPAKDIAEQISKIIKYPTEESIGYPTPGSFGTWAGIERKIPVITLELDEETPVENLIQPAFEIFDILE